ncbi:MAG: glycoside hydrolase family 2 TIM barrel-domain containing protein [Paludibacter sp.]
MTKSVFLTITCLLIFILFSANINANIPIGQSTRLCDNWLFLRSDLGGIWEAVRPAAPESPESVQVWTEVSLPHCYNATDALDPKGNYYQGPAWYKTLISPENPKGRIFLHFEGVGQEAEVYIYTTKVGSHVGGYDEWYVDITDAVAEFKKTTVFKKQFASKIPLSIRVDNSRNLERIPSSMSDFNVYGGIYRHVNLVYAPSVTFKKPAIETLVNPKSQKATITVSTSLLKYSNTENTSISAKLLSPAGKIVAEIAENLNLKSSNFSKLVLELKKPLLWSPDSPTLYTCVVTVNSNAGEQSITEKVGFRYFEFQEKGPFVLNGKRLLLRGTHRHEDHAGVGAAMTDEQIIKEMKLIKDMGANFIRLGHYQQSELVLDLCDELGLIVWEEIPWCRGGLGGEAYQAQAKRMLENMIAQHRNHPSIVLWGMGNENDWPGDFAEFDKQKIRTFMKELNDLSHSLDSTRVTSIRRCDFCNDIIDVYSPSIWAGWYRGVYTDYLKVSETEKNKVNRFLHVEWGGDSHAGRHSEHPTYGLDKVNPSQSADERAGDATLKGGTPRVSKDGDWSESYMVELFDWHLKEQEKMPWLTGTAAWVFKDFSTPLRPENPIPFMNQKGVVERDLTPKESYYVFQSYWTAKPMLHIYGHSWPVRWGEENETKIFKVYSNCSKVELFLNGKSLGLKQRVTDDFPAAGLRWDAAPQVGKNTLKAISTVKSKAKKDSVLVDEISFEYQTEKWGKVAQISCKTIPVSENEMWVEAQLCDSKGVRCLDTSDYIEFDITGDDTLLINQGTASGSSKVQAQNGRARVKVLLKGRNSVVSVKSANAKTQLIQL